MGVDLVIKVMALEVSLSMPIPAAVAVDPSSRDERKRCDPGRQDVRERAVPRDPRGTWPPPSRKTGPVARCRDTQGERDS